MKRITFIRHGKSSWEFNVSDKDRPLKKRGITDSNLVSKKFNEHDFMPQKVFSSPAKRAYQTCENFVKNLNILAKNVQVVENLYDFGGQNVVNFIKSLDNDLDNVMIFGHNHAFTSIVNSFGTRYIDNLPTSGLVTILFDIDNWSDLNQGETVLVILPRDLKLN